MAEEADTHAYDEYDEEAYWGCTLPTPSDGWLRVAQSGENGTWWEDGWDSIRKTVQAIALLEEIPKHKPDWDTLLAGLKHLHVLKSEHMNWPPLCCLRDFMHIGNFFLHFDAKDPLSAEELLYIEDSPSRAPLLAEFEELYRRLREYPPLQPYVRYMG